MSQLPQERRRARGGSVCHDFTVFFPRGLLFPTAPCLPPASNAHVIPFKSQLLFLVYYSLPGREGVGAGPGLFKHGVITDILGRHVYILALLFRMTKKDIKLYI